VHRPRARLDLELTATDVDVPTDCVVNFDNIHTIPRSDFRRQSVKLEPARLAQDSRRHRCCDSSSSPSNRGQRDSIDHTGTGEVARPRHRESPPVVTRRTSADLLQVALLPSTRPITSGSSGLLPCPRTPAWARELAAILPAALMRSGSAAAVAHSWCQIQLDDHVCHAYGFAAPHTQALHERTTFADPDVDLPSRNPLQPRSAAAGGTSTHTVQVGSPAVAVS